MTINFIESTWDSLDLETLKSMTDELIDLYGYPCIYHKYVGPDMINHPLYKDRPTSSNNIEKYIEHHETKVLLENKHFVPQLLAQGYSLNAETVVNAIMKFDDNPDVEDIVTLLYLHEANRYNFQINSATNWKNICWNVVLSVYLRDDMKDIVFTDPPAIPHSRSDNNFTNKNDRRRKRI
jgi:hypothetical protein